MESQNKKKDEISKISKEQEKQDDFLQKRIENRARLQKSIESEKSILFFKSSENEKQKNRNENMSHQISDIDQAISLKKNSLHELIYQDRILRNSVNLRPSWPSFTF